MLQLKDRRSENKSPSVTVEDGDEVLVRYRWDEDSTIPKAVTVFSKRLKEMGETPEVIAEINRQVKSLN